MRRFRALLFVLPLIALSILFLRHGLFGGPDAIVARANPDMATLLYPQRIFALERLRAGEFPLWNPFLFGGIPFHASAHPALLYPPNLLFFAMPTAAAFNTLAAFHLALAGLGAFALLREVGARPAAALFGSVAFAFSARTLLHVAAGQAPLLASLAWTPVLFWLSERLARRATAAGGVALAAAFALAVLGGYPQYVIYASAGVLALATARAVAAAASRRGRDGSGANPERAASPARAARGVLLVAASLAGGAVLAAAQILPSLESARASFRHAAPPDFVAMGYLPVENIATLLFPSALGDGRSAPYFGHWSYGSMCAYAGVATIALAVLSLTGGAAARRRALPWVILGGASLLVALGRQTPLFSLVSRLPVFGEFRGISKMSALTLLSLAVLAGLGMEALLAGPESRRASGGIAGEAGGRRAGGRRALGPRKTAALILALLAATGIAARVATAGEGGLARVGRLYAALSSPNEDFPEGPPAASPAVLGAVRGAIARDAGRVALFAGLVAAAVAIPGSAVAPIATLFLAADLFFAFDPAIAAVSVPRDLMPGAELARALRETPPLARFGASDRRASRGVLCGAAATGGWEGNLPERVFALDNFLSDRPLDAPAIGFQPRRFSPILDLLVMQRLVTEGPVPIDTTLFRLVAQGPKFAVYDRTRSLPRAFLAHAVVVAPDRAALWAEIRDGEHDPYAIAAVERAEDASPVDPLPANAATSAASAPETIDVEPLPEVRLAGANRVLVRAQPASRALLVLLDTFDTGWRATVDGRPARIVPVFGVFRGVYLEPGEHEVIFSFAPRSFAIGAILSLAAVAAAATLLGAGFVRRR